MDAFVNVIHIDGLVLRWQDIHSYEQIIRAFRGPLARLTTSVRERQTYGPLVILKS